jgi:hypothetical protein
MKGIRPVRIYGVDFTSAPRRGKPITGAVCHLADGRLALERIDAFETFDAFEAFLARPGPWVAGLDFPFGQPRRLIEALGWPLDWVGYGAQVEALGMDGFVARLADYRAGQPPGDKQHRRLTDARAESASPMMLYGVPVGRMFLRGAPCLRRAGVSLLPVRPAESDRVVIEAYPALAARRWIGRTSYKSDSRARQTAARRAARQAIVDGLRSESCRAAYGFGVTLAETQAAALVDEPQGDVLDALLAALPAAWAWTRREDGWGIPAEVDPLEGWIVDPGLV